MYKDRIDLAITPEDHTAVDAALLAIEQKYNFTQSLPVEDRKSLYKLAIDKEAFANQILDLAKANLDLLPKGIDLAKIERDKTAREALLSRLQRMRQMTERLEHTVMLLGTDYLSGTLCLYRSLQANGRDAGIEELLADIGHCFSKGRKVKTPEQPGTGTGSGSSASAA
ncbi:hypothetical protein ACXR0O_09330 [Verrucomicrobiota bacterium sgz303538]